MDVTCDVYAFGNFESGYTQYPLDYAKEIFQNIVKSSTAPTQTVACRSKNLIYYIYVRKLDAGQHIGFCVLLNDIMFTKPRGLFPIFEEAVQSLVIDSEILGFNADGNLVPYVVSLKKKQYEIGAVISNINKDVAKLSADKLPVLGYGVAKNQNRHFRFEDADDTRTVNATVENGCTFIDKDRDYDTELLVFQREMFLEAVENGTIDPTKIGLAGKIHKLSINGIVNRLQSFIRKQLKNFAGIARN